MGARSGNPQESGAHPSLARLVAYKSIAPQFVRRNAHGGIHGAKAHSYQAPTSRACRSGTPSADAASRLRSSALLDTRRLARRAQKAARRCCGFLDFLARFYFRLKFRGKVRLVHGHAKSG
jgi:hypothetical protein